MTSYGPRRWAVAVLSAAIVAVTVGVVWTAAPASSQSDCYPNTCPTTTTTTAAPTTTTTAAPTTTTTVQGNTTTTRRNNPSSTVPPARPTTSTTRPPNCPPNSNAPQCRPGASPTIALSIDFGAPGDDIRIVISGLVDDAIWTVRFGDQEVAGGTTPGGGTALGRSPVAVIAPQNLLRAIRGQTSGGHTVSATFAVPNVPPRVYDVCVSATGMRTTCRPFTVTGVGGATQGRGASGSGSGSGSGSSSNGLVGSFARTGLTVLPFAVLAVALLLVGRILVTRSRRSARSRA